VSDLLQAAFIDDAIRQTLSTALEAAGFRTVRPRFWVRSRTPPVRHVVTVAALKGAAYSPIWGISLDYVPHVAGRGTVHWHRTDKSARLDLTYDPVDHESDPGWELSRFSSPAGFSSRCKAIAPRLLHAVDSFVTPLTSDMAIRQAFEAKRKRPTTRFGFENYYQNVLAYAFTLARVGDMANAELWLGRYLMVSEPDDDEIAAALRRLLAEALSRPTRA
jgi:hypothetical protein